MTSLSLPIVFQIAGSAQAPPDPAKAGPVKATAGVKRGDFGALPDGQKVELFTLTNANGVEVRAMTYGAIIVSIRTPDRGGHLDDVVLGFESAADYVTRQSPYFGAVVGRYANRIGAGKFTLDGRAYTLAINNGPNHLHGGVKGFDKYVWRGSAADTPSGPAVAFTRTSGDGEEGYPGNLRVKVTYTLTARNELIIDFEATTDKPTPVNLSQHSYFNLAGQGVRDVLDHQLQIDAAQFTPVDSALIPTGKIAPVAGTPFDFRQLTSIGARINADDEQMKNGGGYDHNFVLTGTAEGLHHAALVVEPSTGRTLEVATTEPGMQFYSGNFLDGTVTGKQGRVYQKRYGFCLETQHFPDSPNKPQFPSTILRPGGQYRSRTIWRFGAK